MALTITEPIDSQAAAKTCAYVIPLQALDGRMIPLAGGKAANLGELIRGGFPVPDGFCVTTKAYAKTAEENAIEVGAFSAAGSEELAPIAGKVREAFRGVAIPPAIAAQVAGAYAALGEAVPVAVRSSATAEDLPHASFAGQQETFLNVVGAAAVLEAVRQCWASLWTDRAVVYRNANGIDQRAVRLAVVVQRMVDAKVAGVLFTANPVTGRRQQAVIDANPGLGEAVVSGAVNPDHFVLDTATGSIVERRIGDKRFQVCAQTGGGTIQVESEGLANEACLTDAQARLLAQQGAKVEAHFGAPQDIEWAFDSAGAPWLTQARPITTLFPLPLSNSGANEDRVFLCFSAAQGLYRPLTPMGLSAIRLLASSAADLCAIPVNDPHSGPPAYVEAGQRVFLDLTNTLRGVAGRIMLLHLLGVMEARSAAVLQRLTDDPRFTLRSRSWRGFLTRVLRAGARLALPFRALEALLFPNAARRRVRKIGVQLAARSESFPSGNATHRLDHIEQILSKETIPAGARIAPVAAAGFACFGLAAKVLGEIAKPGELETVLRGLSHNVTTEMDLALWQLAKSIQSDEEAARIVVDSTITALCRQFREGTLPFAVQGGLADFLFHFGHRAVAEIDAGMPRWSDDPSHLFGVLRNYLRVDDPELSPAARFQNGAQQAEAMIETLAMRVRGRFSRMLVRLLLRRVRQLAGVRELPKYHVVAALAAARRELTKIGSELALRGAIDSAGDVFFLNLKEVRSALHGECFRNVVPARRSDFEDELRRKRVPAILLSDGTDPESERPSHENGKGLLGTPASAGVVTGIARVIHDPTGARIEPGEILVAPSTDPGWTPLFLTAGGLVMEMGGANSHGAVVAREYGIPAVVGVAGAAARIATGQRITVDGAAGVIRFD